jgi:hypothetical protein
MDRERLALWIALIITVVWTASLVVDGFVESYDPPATVHALMMIVAGWAFGERLLGKRNGPR